MVLLPRGQLAKLILFCPHITPPQVTRLGVRRCPRLCVNYCCKSFFNCLPAQKCLSWKACGNLTLLVDFKVDGRSQSFDINVDVICMHIYVC